MFRGCNRRFIHQSFKVSSQRASPQILREQANTSATSVLRNNVCNRFSESARIRQVDYRYAKEAMIAHRLIHLENKARIFRIGQMVQIEEKPRWPPMPSDLISDGPRRIIGNRDNLE